MNRLCVLGFKNDITTIFLIQELLEKNIEFDICVVNNIKKKVSFRYERFIGMSSWSLFFWIDYFKQYMFNRSKKQKHLLKAYLNTLKKIDSITKFEFDDIGSLNNFIAKRNYSIAAIGGFPILKNDFFSDLQFPIIGSHPAPLPSVRGVDHLVFTLYYHLEPAVTIYRLNEKIDGGIIYKVIRNSEIDFEDTFYSIRIKLEIQRAKELAIFISDYFNNNEILPPELLKNIGNLHCYKNVTIKIRKQAEINLKHYLKKLKPN